MTTLPPSSVLHLLANEFRVIEQQVSNTLAKHPAATTFAYPRETLARIGRALGMARSHVAQSIKDSTPAPAKPQEKPMPTQYTADQVITALLAEKKDLQQQIADLKGQIGSQYDQTVVDAVADPDLAAILEKLYPSTGTPTPAATPTLSVADVTVAASTAAAGKLSFAATLSAPATSDVSVAYTTADGTAVAGVDYTTDAGTLIIAAGQSSATIDVTVSATPTPAATAKTLTLTLSNPTGATLGTATATGTITPATPAAA